MFDAMVEDIRTDTAKLMLTARLVSASPEKQALPATAGDGTDRAQPHRSKKIGRNDPCPCGSGKKYKNCCGRNQ